LSPTRGVGLFFNFLQEHTTMDKDQIKGNVKSMTGKLQEAAGKVMDNKDQQRKGLEKQVVGNAEVAIADAKQGVRKTVDALRRAK
jgi:uncharacterized protein YjbJ (UPF0337 family)